MAHFVIVTAGPRSIATPNTVCDCCFNETNNSFLGALSTMRDHVFPSNVRSKNKTTGRPCRNCVGWHRPALVRV